MHVSLDQGELLRQPSRVNGRATVRLKILSAGRTFHGYSPLLLSDSCKRDERGYSVCFMLLSGCLVGSNLEKALT